MREIPTERWKTLLAISALAMVYTAVAKLGLSLDAVSGFATLVWPSTGLALAALLVGGFRLWPGILLGAFAVNSWAGAPVMVALGIAVGNTLEALVGAFALRRFCHVEHRLETLRQMLGLILYAATMSTIISASVGVATLALGGVLPSLRQAASTWRAWWVGDVLGDLVVAPMLLVSWARRGERRALGHWRTVEALALGALLVAAGIAVFFGRSRPLYPFESPYVLFPLFVWAALRFELRGAALATFVASALAIWGTARGGGPFARESLSSGLLALQTFMGCAAITPLVVAGVTMDRARAIRAQEVFMASVSHDLRSPLHALLMSSQAFERTPTEDGARKHHQLVRRSVDRMTRLITDLVDASAIERGRLAMEPRAEDARALIQEAVDLMRPLATAKRLILRVDLPDPTEILCDRGRILQMLANVVGNAIKFAPESTTVTVKVVALPKTAAISVEDRGPGISAGDLPHIFERYWHTKTSLGGGTGLGLFISKAIVEAHGGRIWAESRPGVGTTFHITLPVGTVRGEPAFRTG